jgi:hypothetical protein
MQSQYEPIDSQAIANLDKQIDNLFDDLKKKIYDITAPRSNSFDKLKGWAGKQIRSFADRLQQPKRNPLFSNTPTQECNLSLNLEQYSKLKFLVEELESKVNENNGFVDRILDQYKNRLKDLVKSYTAQPKIVPRVIKNDPSEQNPHTGSEFDERLPDGFKPHDPWTLDPIHPEPESPVEQPKPQAASPMPTSTPTITPTATMPTQPKTPPSEKPKREKRKKPEPLPQSTGEAPAVRQLSREDVQNIKLGYALEFAKHLFGNPPSEQDIKVAIEQTKDHDVNRIPQNHYDEYIETAKAYKAAKPQATAASTTTQAPQVGPMDVAPAPESTEKSKEQLAAMTPKELKDFLKDHDPELIDVYDDRDWTSKHLRKEIIANYLHTRSTQRPRSESFEQKVQSYKSLLRKTKI